MAQTRIEGIIIPPAERFEMCVEDAVRSVTGDPHGDLTDGDIYELINDSRRKVSPLAPQPEVDAAAEEMCREWTEEAE